MKAKILVVLLIVAALAGARAYPQYRSFNQAEQHYHKGDDLLLTNAPALAIAEFQQAVASYPEHQGAWVGLCQCYVDLKSPDQLLDTCDKALVHCPRGVEFYKLKAEVYRSKGDSAQEIANLEKAVAIDPDDPLVGKLLQRARKQPATAPAAAPATPTP